jgi:RNA polymerase sigma factor (sigma-70 family)
MNTGPLVAPLAEVRMSLAALALAADSEPDAELLRRFADARDERAFAALVRRFGPMVLGVCRRVARDSHAAEDAFQAAFVVLARRAAEVREGTVRGWLYGVAVRCAKGVRAMQARQRARETPVAEVPERAADEREVPDADLLAALDQAVGALPEHLRAAVVLCELDGLSRADAAARLGIAEGTLSSRLAKARKLLARALQKRGLAVPAAGFAVLSSSAPVSARLAASTAALLTADQLPATVAALSHGVFRAMFAQKLKALALIVALALGALAGVALALPNRVAPPPVAPQPRAAGTAKALPKGPNKLVYYHAGHIVTANPDGTGAARVVEVAEKHFLSPGRLAFAPDGSAVLAQPTICTAMVGPIDTHLVRLNPELGAVTVAKLEDARTLTAKLNPFAPQGRTVCWSADGTKFLETGLAEEENGKGALERYAHQITDLATGTGTKIDLPSDQRVFDWGPDGAFLALQLVPHTTDAGIWEPKFRLWILDANGKPDTEIESPDADFYPNDPKFARDGRKVLFSLMRKEHDKTDNRHFKSDEGLVVYDRDTKKLARVGHVPEGARILSSCWSPDGKRIAYSWHTSGKEDEKRDWYVTVCDASGANAKHVVKARGTLSEYPIGEIAWR